MRAKYPYPRIAVSLEIKDSKAANVTQSIDVNGEFAEEVDDSRSAIRESVPEDEGRDDDGKDLLNEEGDFHLKELSESAVYLQPVVSGACPHRASETTDLGGVKFASPFDRKIMSIFDDFPHYLLRVDDLVLIRHHPSRDRQHRSEHSNIEQNSSSRRNFEMKKSVGVDDREEDEDGGERPSEEGDESRDEGSLLLGELTDVLLRNRMSVIESLREEVRELVEFSKLPSS